MLYVNRIQSVLEEVVLFHELGHYVGMGHSSNRNSVMYPYLWGQEAPWFTDDDWRQVE
jgi:predicted Zn-dependent protease